MYDDKALQSSFQTGLRFRSGKAKPAYGAYRLADRRAQPRPARRLHLGPRAPRHGRPLRSALRAAAGMPGRASTRTRAATSASSARRKGNYRFKAYDDPDRSSSSSARAARRARYSARRGRRRRSSVALVVVLVARGGGSDAASSGDGRGARRTRRCRTGKAKAPGPHGARVRRPHGAAWSVFEDHTALIRIGAAARASERSTS